MASKNPRGALWAFLTSLLSFALIAAITGTEMSWLFNLLCPLAGLSLLLALVLLSTKSPESTSVLEDDEELVRDVGVKCRDVYAKAFGVIPVPARGTLFATSKRLLCVRDGEMAPARLSGLRGLPRTSWQRVSRPRTLDKDVNSECSANR